MHNLICLNSCILFYFSMFFCCFFGTKAYYVCNSKQDVKISEHVTHFFKVTKNNNTWFIAYSNPKWQATHMLRSYIILLVLLFLFSNLNLSQRKGIRSRPFNQSSASAHSEGKSFCLDNVHKKCTLNKNFSAVDDYDYIVATDSLCVLKQ